MLLLINDDGIHAPGMAALEEAVAGMGPYVVVAPQDHLSGCGHQTTTHRPLEVTSLAPHRHMVNGLPADCTRLGLTLLAPDSRWVIAGINEGGNLGADVYSSGTVAAAREAALLGRPAIAISHYVRRGVSIDWRQAAQWTRRVVAMLMARSHSAGEYWSVNLPHLSAEQTGSPEQAGEMPPTVDCPLDGNPLPISYRREDERLIYSGNYHQRQRDPGSDVDECFSGRIAVVRLTVRGGG